MADIEPALVRATRIVHASPEMGFPPFATSRQTDPGLARALRGALLTMPETEDGRAILATLRLDGFAPPTAGLFDGIAALSRRVREAG